MKKPIPFGKYYLLERINVGGMAEVFRAKAYGVEGFERLVAVKRILPNIAEDTEFIKMFIDEAKIAVQLNHANIAQIFDLGMVDGSYYIALEHVHGRDLRAIFDRCRNLGEPMPIAQACFVVMKVCEGLDYAHNKRDQSGRELNLVHRDVSPQNILTSFEGEVKLIDFGIAKAAGKGSKTQAGILKGKFGYMSPEQVRGLPIDRRSDIFSCGIVLYELLTGERLFVGESDFSTLEKVRNVEILPPSTYNRRIPDELERIVLKALAKDVDDRYQNAIDLHDELQAFVYTAGEFYSRKDLAAWMKKTFAKEIEDETAKLESYRRLRPPDARTGGSRTPPPEERPRRSTLAMPSVAGGARTPPPIPTNGRRSAQQPAVAARNGAKGAPGELEWDDDELETQIYDNPDELKGRPGMPDAAPAPMSAVAGAAPAASAPPPAQPGGAAAQEPDLSSLVKTAKGWDSAPNPPPPRQPTMPMTTPAPTLANGSSQTPAPFGGQPAPYGGQPAPFGGPAAPPPPASPILDSAAPVFDSPVADTLQPALSPSGRSRTGLIAAVAAAAVLLIGGGVTAFMLTRGDGGGSASAAGAAGAEAPASDTAAAVAADTGLSKEVLAGTGFDLFVTPSQGVRVKLDGKRYDVRLPMQVRNIAPGDHVVEVEGPPGFFSKTQTITVEAGKAPRVDIELDAIDITGRFTSTPPGAEVTLVSEGQRASLGETPAEVKLDPRRRYEVIFEKRGYVTQTRPITITGRPVEPIEAVLEKTGRGTPSVSRTDDRPSVDLSASTKSPGGSQAGGSSGGSSGGATSQSSTGGSTTAPVEGRKDEPKPDPPAERKPAEKGTLLLGAKPPCQIYIDGRNTGLVTPQRSIELTAGRHKITLINNEHNIKETFVVTIKPNEETKVIKDMSDRIQ